MSNFILCRASDLSAHERGQIHFGFLSGAEKTVFFVLEGVQVAFENKAIATAVQVRLSASKCGQQRAGCTITRTRLVTEKESGGGRR